MVGSLDDDAMVGTGEFACECGCECESINVSGMVMDERVGASEDSMGCCCGSVWALMWAWSWSWGWRGVLCC